MYCPVCGEEIIIVSDFEIKLEDNIDMAALAKTNELPDLKGLSTKESTTDPKKRAEQSDAHTKYDNKAGNRSGKTIAIDRKWLILFGVLGALFLFGCIFGGLSISRYFSIDSTVPSTSLLRL